LEIKGARMKKKSKIQREEAIREYDGKTVVWEKKFMPEMVENYKRIKRKEYCDPYFWTITEVKDGEKKNEV
jgi:hypothetical protein